MKFCDFSLTNYLDIVKNIDINNPLFKPDEFSTIGGLYASKDFTKMYEVNSP